MVGKVLDEELDALGVLLLGLAVQTRDLVHKSLVPLRKGANVVVEGFLRKNERDAFVSLRSRGGERGVSLSLS